MPVETPHSDYINAANSWNRLRDTFAGRDAIIAAGEAYTPKLPGADVKENKAYLTRGSFFNAVSRTVYGLLGSIFQKAPNVNIVKSLEHWLRDITLTGVTLDMFALDIVHDVMLVGRAGILVEMSADEASQTKRPYLCSYKAEDIINWRTTRIGGDEIVTRVVLYEIAVEQNPEDEFVGTEIPQYRVLELTINEGRRVYSQQLWRKPDGATKFKKFEDLLIPTRRQQPLEFIPFIFLGPLHATPRVVKPPLLDLADLNLSHWRNSCDHEQGLHLVALPTPWVAGMQGSSSTDDEDDDGIGIGPSRVWELDVNGKAGMLEFGGAGLKAIIAAMEAKKSEMAITGSRVLESQPSTSETATAVGMRHAGEHATLRTITQAAEQGITQAIQILVWWVGTEKLWVDIDASVALNKDFLNIKASSDQIKTALLALMDGKISFDTWWRILVDGSWVDDDVTAEEEKRKIELEIPDDPGLDGKDNDDDLDNDDD